MSQIKFYGLSNSLAPRRKALSDTVHSCVMEVLGLPVTKRAHRFIRLEAEDFFMPEGRSEAYTIIEIQMIEGRTKETKKRLVRALFDRIGSEIGIAANDIEITILEAAPENWGFRGLHGDEVNLPYQIKI